MAAEDYIDDPWLAMDDADMVAPEEDFWALGCRYLMAKRSALRGDAYKLALDNATKTAMAEVGMKTWAMACAAEDQRREERRPKLLALIG